MGRVACNAIEFGFIRCCGDPNGVCRSRVPKSTIDKIEYCEFLKCLWLHSDFPVEEREWPIASHQPHSIGAVARKTEVRHGRVQIRGVVGSVSIVAESAGHVDRLMNILAGEFKLLQLFKHLRRQAYKTAKEREWLAALNYLL